MGFLKWGIMDRKFVIGFMVFLCLVLIAVSFFIPRGEKKSVKDRQDLASVPAAEAGAEAGGQKASASKAPTSKAQAATAPTSEAQAATTPTSAGEAPTSAGEAPSATEAQPTTNSGGYPADDQIGLVDTEKNEKMLLNKFFKLPDEWSPADLTDVPEGYYVNDGKEYKLARVTLDAFLEMAADAAEDGLDLKVISGYRSAKYQLNLYNYYVNTHGKEAADTFSARSRHSEHETGYAVDINDVHARFGETAEFAWLQKNAEKYGFILRYPQGKEHITGYMYEPWHWRYVGDIAESVVQSGLTYDEYYKKYLE